MAKEGKDEADRLAILDVSNPGDAKIVEVLWERDRELDVAPSWPVYFPEGRRCYFSAVDNNKRTLYSVELKESRRRSRWRPREKTKSSAVSRNSLMAHSCSRPMGGICWCIPTGHERSRSRLTTAVPLRPGAASAPPWRIRPISPIRPIRRGGTRSDAAGARSGYRGSTSWSRALGQVEPVERRSAHSTSQVKQVQRTMDKLINTGPS